ncbi:hypothetical protein L198_00956 [Cryptococcus wingfieldii CBS 7118]|uniref:Uncharacterized protein n=1 Tax=Cryptococcus wingfieldii CBS 7118 TaxID=1295528 RepID=A0A1E3K4E1_9TREE|nr:hypothetical protein L198_00956 [Cryptococcus wingfieldii CBS 7118]ODO07377.1 hypothetical protein L198_00956 [Cryptococcus wingfieldii CBS 7118]
MSFTTYVAALLVLVAPAAFAAPAAAAEPTLEGQNFGAPGGAGSETALIGDTTEDHEREFIERVFPDEELIVKRDGSIVREPQTVLDDDLKPDASFTPDDWYLFQFIKDHNPSHVRHSPGHLRTRFGLSLYFNWNVMTHLSRWIAAKEHWVSDVGSSHWSLGPDETLGSADWLCKRAFGVLRGECEVKQGVMWKRLSRHSFLKTKMSWSSPSGAGNGETHPALPCIPPSNHSFANPFGTLSHLAFEHLQVGTIVKELEMDTTLCQVLTPSGYAPVTLGLWRGFWVNPEDVSYDKNGKARGWLMYVSIQEDMRRGGEWKAVGCWSDVASETREGVVEWLKTVHEMGYTNGDFEPRHLYVAKGGSGWKIIDWGKGRDRSVDEDSLWKEQMGDETYDLRHISYATFSR